MRPRLPAVLVRLLLLLAAAAPCLLSAPAVQAEIWQWTDAEGVIRYTPNPDRIPDGRRSTMVKVAPGMPLVTKPEEPPDAPAIAGPPGDFEADPFNAPQRARSVEVTEVPEPAWAVDSAPPDAADTAAAAAAGAGAQTPSDEIDPWVTPESDAAADTASAAEAAAGGAAASLPPVESPPPPVATAPPGEPAASEPKKVARAATTAAETTGAAASTGTAATTAASASSPAASTTSAAGATTAASPSAAATAAAAGNTAASAAPAAPATAAAASVPAADPWSAVAMAGASATAPEGPLPPAALTAEQRSRIDELEELIARDEEALKELLSDTELDAEGFEESPELREIALRLPALQRELRALKEGRAPEAEEAP
jgi:hypothetical protein